MFTDPLEVDAAVTVRLITAVWLKLPDLPVMVTVASPGAAEAAAVRVRIALAGVAPPLNEPVTPVGRPERLTVTEPAKPFCGVKVRVLAPVAPCATLSAVGEADKLNVGGGVMASAMVVLLVKAPDVPVIVTVAVAAAAVLAAVNVRVLCPPVTAPAVAMTPAGKPETASATVPLKPL